MLSCITRSWCFDRLAFQHSDFGRSAEGQLKRKHTGCFQLLLDNAEAPFRPYWLQEVLKDIMDSMSIGTGSQPYYFVIKLD